MNSQTLITVGIAATLVACAGADKAGPGGDETAVVPAQGARGHSEDKPPSFEIPAWQRAGVGQEIGFGLEVIDEDQSEVRVELVGHPPSAKFDPITLTVVWTPTVADKPAGLFTVQITENPRDGLERVYHHGFAIEVMDKKQPKPRAQPLTPAVEQFITIHDKERLKEVNKIWPIDVLLAHGAKTQLDLLPEETRSGVAKLDKDALYHDMLHSLAKANHNPRVDPESKEFDKKAFGDPRSWELIAVRPRIDKKWHEVRLVYRAQKSHAATYVMFKFRPTPGNAPPEVREYNNKTFSQLVAFRFFDKTGKLRAEHTKDKTAHGKAVADFVNDVVAYADPKVKWAHGTFLGLPAESRLGGGSKRKADGSYDSGDGWGWNVMKAKLDADEKRIVIKNVPIKGFATKVVAKDGKWAMACAAFFSTPPYKETKLPYKKLCRESGHADLPGGGDGYHEAAGGLGERETVVSAKVDAANLFRDYKASWMIGDGLPLRDPRRDLFEEKGMTCSQCHVRKFGVRNMYDKRAYDSTDGVPRAMNKKQAPTYFVITPTERWQPYAIDFQHKQECKFKVNMEKELGRKFALTCPLGNPPGITRVQFSDHQ